VGVKRQYCGELGKRANCQAGVFVGYVSSQGYTVLDRRLYVPTEWLTDDGVCGTAQAVRHAVRHHLQNQACIGPGDARRGGEEPSAAVSLGGGGRGIWGQPGLSRWGGWAGPVVFCRSAHTTRVWDERPATHVPPWRGRGRRPQRQRLVAGAPEARTVFGVAAALPAAAWTRHTIKEGSQGPMVAEFAAIRVLAVRDALPGPDVWLVLRRHVETGELKTYLCNAPVDTAVETRVRMSGMRWPIETCFEDSKQLLGMGDYEVRSWTGWQHHMTLVILAHFFVVRMSLRLKKSPGSDVAPGRDGVGDGLAPPRV